MVTISVIIPTYNAARLLPAMIGCVGTQTIPCEVIVIDSSSSDNTVEIARSSGAKTMVIAREDFDHGGTRNLGAQQAGGDILVFLTQDAVPDNEYFLENLVRPLENPDVAAAYGRQVPRVDAAPPERFSRLFNYPPVSFLKGRDDLLKLGIKTFFFTDVCSAVRRKEFHIVGGFPERIIMNEDMVLSAKLILKGYKIAYAADARVVHSHNYTMIQLFRRYFDIGVSLQENPWILELAKAGGKGAEFVREEIRYLFRERELRWLPHVFFETAAKYSGYRLGLNNRLIPRALKKKMSMHSFYWEKVNSRQKP